MINTMSKEVDYEPVDEDEDVDDEVATQLKPEDYREILDAQEPSTMMHYDGIKITPFNLKEEFQEGNFDKAGNFIFAKRQRDTEENPSDNWADTVDWASVEAQASSSAKQENGKEDQDEEMPPARDRSSCYKEMLSIMKPHETVQQAIRRLGNSIPKRRPKTKSTTTSSAQTDAGVTEAKKDMEQIIELAHQMLEEGDTDIYQKSYDDLRGAI